MTTIDFKEAIAELLDQMYSTIPKDEESATTRSQSAIDATRRSSQRLVPRLYETHSFEKAPK